MDNWLFLTEQEILEEIGKRLKKIRLQHNLTQKEMSEEVGLSVSTISLIEQGKWQISPAYDITFQYKAGGTWTNVHQSSINGKFDNFTRNDLLNLGKIFGIKKANHILEEVITAVNQWSKIATEIDIPKKEIENISNNLRVNYFK
ncbi:MAG: helix-turn-helix domain-containing protein [Bacteroidales bacterium]|nr:helix-turn-helix domain-containing protein [Bacteroidales bacterium]